MTQPSTEAKRCAHCNGTGFQLPEKCCLTCKNKRIVHTISVCALDRLPIKADMVCSRWELDAEGEALKPPITRPASAESIVGEVMQ